MRPLNLSLSPLLVTLLLLALAGTASPQHLKLSHEEVAQTADLIFVGTVAGQSSRVNDAKNMVFTDVLFKKIQVAHAKSVSVQRRAPEIRLTFAGGTAGGLSFEVGHTPKLLTGRRYLVFMLDDGRTYSSPLVGGEQGLFEVVTDPVTQEQYLRTSGGKIVVGADDDEGIRLSTERSSGVNGGTLIIDPSDDTAPGGYTQQAPSPAGPGDSSSARRPEFEPGAARNRPLKLKDFLDFVLGVSLKKNITVDRLKRDGVGSFYKRNGDRMEAHPLELHTPDPRPPSAGEGIWQFSPFSLAPAAAPPGGGGDSPHGGPVGACGYHTLPLVMEQVPSSFWSYPIVNDNMFEWNLFMDIFRYRDSDGSWGDNSSNEYGAFADSDALDRIYGFRWSPSTLAVMVSQKDSGQPTCGRFSQTDVLWNAAMSWTSDADFALGNSGVVNLRPVNHHETGHVWGMQTGTYAETYDYDVATVMQPYYYNRVEDGRGVHRADAYMIRRIYQSQTAIRATKDIGVESYYASNGLINSTTNATSFAPGQSITLNDVTVENMSYAAVSDLRIRFYLSTNRTISTGDYQMGSYWFWTSFPAETYSVADYTTTIPANVPPGQYYVGAIVTPDGFGSDEFAPNNTTSFYFPITVVSGGGGQSNLRPYQPAGWSDEIVVSTATGANTDSSPLRPTDALYVDWAVSNSGTAATAAVFHTKLLVDGVERASWFINPPMNANTYAFVTDYPVGSLTAGTHTIKIVTDSGGAISETNEADNEYTKTITVAAPAACFLLTANVSPSGGGTITRNAAPDCAAGAADPDLAAEPASPGVQPPPEALEASVAAVSGVARSAAAVQAFKTLRAKAKAEGEVGVIVGLNVQFQSEAKLSGGRAVQEQRTAIARSQDRVLDGLVGYDPASVKKYYFIAAMALKVDAAGLARLEASPDVTTIEEDIRLAPALASSTQLIGAPLAWASGFSGAGQTVAILDSGVDKNHPFLAGKVVSEACYSSTFCPGGAPSSTAPGSGVNCGYTGCDHGTHVAGIAAGKGPTFSGVARDANVIAIQVFSLTPEGIRASYSDILSALQRVQTLGSSYNIAAVNMSLGGGRYTSACDLFFTQANAAVDSLRSAGIATVISSGNEGFTNGIGFPACLSGAVSVGSTDDGSQGTTADAVSSFIPGGGSNSASFLNLLAPGKWIESSVPGSLLYQHFQGTSMAAPHVAGAWAVLKSKSPVATVPQVLSALTSTGVPVTDARNGVTKPRIKLDAAVNALGGGGGGGGGQYTSGAAVTLTAVPSVGYAFQSWTGCASVSGGNCTVAMSAARTVTANFAQIQTRTLTVASVNPAGGVGITLSPNDNGGAGGGASQFARTYNNNTQVTLTAPATAAGNNFQKWQRNGVDWATTAAASVTMNANYTMTAVYAVATPTVQFSAAALGVTEGGARANVTVTRAGNTSGTSTVNYRTVDNTAEVGCANTTTMPGVAFARCDYATSVGTISFAPAETSKTLSVPIINDGHSEPGESFQIALSGPSGGTSLGPTATTTVTITDNDSVATANPVLTNLFFVRQHYLDFLSREPEVGEPWTNILNNCLDPFNTNPASPSARCDRNLVSSSFFRSAEFELKGGYVFRFYRVAFGRLPLYTEIIPDMSSVTGQTAQEVLAKKGAFASAFVSRQEFASAYGSATNDAYVNTLLGRYAISSITTPDPAAPDGAAKVTLTTATLVSRLNAGTLTRAQVLRAVADSDQVGARDFNRAFVAMQYYGYLRRTPETTGFNNWLNYLNANPQDFRTMINGFINSTEYRLRFGN